MNLRGKLNALSKTILGNLRTKIIIFSILSLIAVCIVYKTRINNRDLIITKNNVNSNISNLDSNTEIKSVDSSSNITEELNKQNEKERFLEDKYKESVKDFSNKKYVECINVANEIIDQDKNSYKAYNIKGIALCYNKDFDEGMKNIEKALELSPNYGYARFNKALAYELYGFYDEALTWYDKDLEVENYIWSYYGKASIYGRRGDVENTIKYLKIAIDISPDIKKIASEEADFGPVKDSKEFQALIK
jgi:tetratricopeptide (TPR) repeat protein